MKKRLTKRKKIKLKKKYWIRKVLVFSVFLFLMISFINNMSNGTYIKNLSFEDNIITIKYKSNYDNIYCILYTENDIPTLDNENWVQGLNHSCIMSAELNNNYKIYLKNDNEIIYTYTSDAVLYFEINEELDYLPIDSDYHIKYDFISININPKEIIWTTSDSNIVTVSDGVLHPIKSGNISIKGTFGKYNDIFEKYFTDLIVSRSKNYDFSREYLSCNKYTKEQNDLLDKILKFKIEKIGYQTRAGVVEAARFLTLSFPYKIDYAYENGRVTTNGVDGEGRYYHNGLFLDESRFELLNKSRKGPETWGCSIYSTGKKKYQSNGLDCSGFVSWALLNGGFDIKDIGAGFSSGKDLTDYGELKSLTKSLSKSDTIKVGDLLHSDAAGGHIAIIIGIDENNYYVAQALWYGKTGVVITTYSKDKLPLSFPHVVLMDKYYKNDGKYTEMWY